MDGLKILDKRPVTRSKAYSTAGTVFTVHRDGFDHDFEVFLPAKKDAESDLEAYFVELAKRDPEYRAWDEARKK